LARLLIINADDFGLSQGVNEGILEAHTRGVVTSTSLMVYRPAARAAAADAQHHRELSVGLHFVEDGIADLDDSTQLETAFTRQLELFREFMGNDPTHVDSHHHVHAEGDRMATFVKLAEQLGVPLRHDGKAAYIGGFWAHWQPGVTELRYVSRRFLLELIANEAREGFTELACHPARVIGDFDSSYLTEREVELKTLTSPGLRDEIAEAGVRLVSFRDWRT
jgi:predicted glycoside hydrolase/deacetylase ChbG (UPF0249 family)